MKNNNEFSNPLTIAPPVVSRPATPPPGQDLYYIQTDAFDLLRKAEKAYDSLRKKSKYSVHLGVCEETDAPFKVLVDPLGKRQAGSLLYDGKYDGYVRAAGTVDYLLK